MSQKLLSKCEKRAFYKVDHIEGDVEQIRFFGRIGLYKGVTFELVQIINKHYIVYIKNSRYAMEKALASLLVVDAI